MKPRYYQIVGLSLLLLGACADRAKEAEEAKQEAEAKARADAARSEMQKLPQTFKPRHDQKLEPPLKEGTNNKQPER